VASADEITGIHSVLAKKPLDEPWSEEEIQAWTGAQGLRDRVYRVLGKRNPTTLRMEWTTMNIARQPDCPVCKDRGRQQSAPGDGTQRAD